LNRNVNFSLAVTGGFNTDNIAVVRNSALETKCPRECSGQCNEGRCVCDSSHTGSTCQIAIDTIKFNQNVSSNTIPRKYRYFKIDIKNPSATESFNISVIPENSKALIHACITDKPGYTGESYCRLVTSSFSNGPFIISDLNYVYVMLAIIDQSPQKFSFYALNPNSPKEDPITLYDFDDDVNLSTKQVNITDSEHTKYKTAIVLGVSISCFIIVVIVAVSISWIFCNSKKISGATSLSESYESYSEDEKTV
jgi:hypothetical protein